MDVRVVIIGTREFLRLGDTGAIPVDRIVSFDFRGDSVRIITVDPDEDHWEFAHNNCKAIRDFLNSAQR